MSIPTTDRELARCILAKVAAFGGVTVNADGATPGQLSDGYMVGGLVPSLKLAADTRHALKLATDWVTVHRPIAAERGAYLGGWRDDDGNVWLDVSECLTDRDVAVRTGTERGKLAVWDIADGYQSVTA